MSKYSYFVIFVSRFSSHHYNHLSCFRSGFTLERTKRERRSTRRSGFQLFWKRWDFSKKNRQSWDLLSSNIDSLSFLKNTLRSCPPQVEARLAKKSEESCWLVGSSLTWADLYLFHYLTSWTAAVPDLIKPFPHCQKLVEGVREIPQLKEWIATRPKTAM